jgi:hypothetical protein
VETGKNCVGGNPWGKGTTWKQLAPKVNTIGLQKLRQCKKSSNLSVKQWRYKQKNKRLTQAPTDSQTEFF